MPSRRVVRLDTQGRETSERLRCYCLGAIVAEPGLLNLEQCLAILLTDGECVEGISDELAIKRDGELVGYIQIVDVEHVEAESVGQHLSIRPPARAERKATQQSSFE
jgi:hypothetical protein